MIEYSKINCGSQPLMRCDRLYAWGRYRFPVTFRPLPLTVCVYVVGVNNFNIWGVFFYLNLDKTPGKAPVVYVL